MTAFRSIVCALDGSAGGEEAARQAVLLAGPETEVLLLGVPGDDGGRAEGALERAAAVADEQGVGATVRTARGGNVERLLLDASGDADLLVVGEHGGPGGAGVLLGDVASAAVHTAPVPVLVARQPPEGREFPIPVLVATDGSPDAERGVEVAGRIATAHGSPLALVHVKEGHSQPEAALARSAGALKAAGGVEPRTIDEFGLPGQRLPEVARRERASLLLVGSRGVGRARTLGSVSERLAHEAPCSVLVAR